MKRTLAIAGVVAAILFVAGLCALAEEKAPAPAPAVDAKAMMANCTAAMKQMGMPQGMILRCRVLCAAEVSSNDPAAILTLKDDLGLTEDQARKLRVVSDRARADSVALLTADQRAKLQVMAGTPSTMMEMCAQMAEKCKAMGAQGGMMCPMMPAAAPTPKPEK